MAAPKLNHLTGHDQGWKQVNSSVGETFIKELGSHRLNADGSKT
jgi:hypothetical protein